MSSASDEIIAALVERVRKLEDINAIAALKAEYCDAMDGGWDRPAHDAERAIKLFLDDGSWSATGLGDAAGRVAMLALFKDFGRFPFAFHRITNQVITVEGDRATGTWHVLVPIKFSAEDSSWIGGIYTDEFRRTAAGWKIKSVAFRQALISQHAAGWKVGAEV